MCKKSDEFKRLYAECQSKIAKLENDVNVLECKLANKEAMIELYKQDYVSACKMGEVEKAHYQNWKDDYRLRFKRRANAVGIIILTIEIFQIISFLKWI